jgi:hypothetical protein
VNPLVLETDLKSTEYPSVCQALAKAWDVFSVQKEHPAPAMRVYRAGWREYAFIGKCQDEPLAQFVYCHVQPYVIGEVAFRCTAIVPCTAPKRRKMSLQLQSNCFRAVIGVSWYARQDSNLQPLAPVSFANIAV